MPLPIVVALIIILSIAATYALVLIVRGALRTRVPFHGTSDIEGFYITVLGAIYAIFIAFMIFVVWMRFYDATIVVEREADELGHVHRLSRALPQRQQDQMRTAVNDYAQAVSRYEWPAMKEERASRQMQSVVDRMWDIVYSLGPEELPDEVLRDHLLSSFEELMDLRRLRLLQSQTSLPGLLYTVLIFGALLIIGFASIFAVEDFWPHVIKACVLASLISLMIFTVWALDHPFRGWVHVSSQPFERLLEVTGD